MIPALELLFRYVVAERMGTIILSAIVAHTGLALDDRPRRPAAVPLPVAGADCARAPDRTALADGDRLPCGYPVVDFAGGAPLADRSAGRTVGNGRSGSFPGRLGLERCRTAAFLSRCVDREAISLRVTGIIDDEIETFEFMCFQFLEGIPKKGRVGACLRTDIVVHDNSRVLADQHVVR